MATERIRGNLSTQGRLRGNLYRSGGGSSITIDPVYNSGIKIADYNIDGEAGELYIPQVGHTETILYSNDGVTNPATITLSDSILNYDTLYFTLVRTFDGIPDSIINPSYLTSVMSTDYVFNLFGWSGNNEFVLYKLTNNTTLTKQLEGGYLYIKSITGVKN